MDDAQAVAIIAAILLSRPGATDRRVRREDITGAVSDAVAILEEAWGVKKGSKK